MIRQERARAAQLHNEAAKLMAEEIRRHVDEEILNDLMKAYHESHKKSAKE